MLHKVKVLFRYCKLTILLNYYFNAVTQQWTYLMGLYLESLDVLEGIYYIYHITVNRQMWNVHCEMF